MTVYTVKQTAGPQKCASVNIVLYYVYTTNCAELNQAGPAVQTMLAWFGPAHFSSVLLLLTLSNKLGPQKYASVNVVLYT